MMKIRVRAIVGVMIFLGYFLIYIVRYNLSVHIVDMVELPKRFLDLYYNESNSLRTVLNKRVGNVLDIMYWNEIKMALLLAAYHIGYCVCFPIFHNIGDIFGPTWVVGATGFTSGVLNCLTSASAYYNFWLLFVVRILIGFCAVGIHTHILLSLFPLGYIKTDTNIKMQGAMLPSMIQLLRHWAPPTERHHFMWAYCGITTGTCCTFLLCSAVQYYFGWAVGFYISGTAQILWAGLWLMLVTDSPAKHSFISREELSFLSTAIGTVFNIKLTNSQAPWKLILKSIPFWSLCILNFGYAWMIMSLCIYGPLYYTIILNYSIYEAAALSALPFLLRLILGTIIIQTYHWYKHNINIKRIIYLRKYFIVVSHVIPGTLIASAWLMPLSPGPVLLTAAIALTAAGMDLTLDLCYDLSPNYVNSINTVIKIIGHLPGILISLVVGEVTYKYKNLISVWRFVWCFHGTILLFSGLIFLIWGDTHVQSWNDIKRRVKRQRRVVVRPSTMSNITEVDEDEYSSHGSLPQRPKRFKTFKFPKT